MEILFYYILPLLLATTIILHRLCRGGGGGKHLPPSPPSLPIIGHLHLLKDPRHLSLAALTRRYGPIVFLRLGTRPAIVVSSPEIFQEILVNHDAIFANHPSTHAGHALSYGGTAMFFSPYGPHFRALRRLTSAQLFSAKRLSASAALRREELLSLARRMAGGGGEVVLKEVVFEMNYNMISKMVVGKRFFGEDVEEAELAERFRGLLREILDVLFAFNPRDFFPGLAWADLMGVDRKVEGIRVRLDGFLTDLVEEVRRRRIGDGAAAADVEDGRTFVDVMLSMQELDPEGFTDEHLKGQVMTMLTAGSDTTAAVTETVMLMLLCHPEIMKKTRSEIDDKIPGRLLEETDLAQLPYLHCVVKETTRLAHFLSGFPPHFSSEDCTIGGYHVPRNTMVMMNTLSLKKDPVLWDDSMAFKPERFAGGSGWRDGIRHFPFGLGRRACPGESLAVRMVPYAVGFFVQCFDWDPMTPVEVDLSGLMGMTKRMGNPVVARYSIREDMMELLSTI